MSKHIIQPKLNANTLMRVITLFQKQGWKMETENMVGLFNRYCIRLSQLTSEEQKLVLSLTERFRIINQTEYLHYFHDMICDKDLLAGSKLVNSKKIYILPLISKEDVGKIKSSSFLWYGLKSTEIKYEPFFEGKELLFREDTANLKNKLNSNEDAILILVDDYVGTGETAHSAVKECKNQGIKLEKIIVIALAAQEMGIEYLEAKGICVYANVILKRGISDYYLNNDLKNAISTMRKIEKKLSISKDFNLGYKGSEALIKLNRTPNNTFPVFWFESKTYATAPFPR